MSVFYGVRLTEEMDAKITATGKGKSAVIQEALEAYFAGSQEGAKSAIGKPIKTEAAREIEAERPKATERLKAEKPAVSGGCGKHPGAGGFPKAGGWYCLTCGKVV
jgi:hypothetical protein